MISDRSSAWLVAVVAVLVLWRVAVRVRLMVARQRLSVVRAWFTAVVFPCGIALLLLASFGHPGSTLGLLAGLAIGCGLGWWGNRLTRFEVTDQGLYFTPNAPLGLALSALFIGRVLYRVAELALMDGGFAPQQSDIAGSPLTLSIFGTLAAYYVASAVGVLRWRGRVRRLQAASSASSTNA